MKLIDRDALLEAIKTSGLDYDWSIASIRFEGLINSAPAVSGDVVTTNKYYIGQRVLIDDSVIGKVVVSETGRTNFGIWVFNPANGYASDYSFTSIKPLPNGQL